MAAAIFGSSPRAAAQTTAHNAFDIVEPVKYKMEFLPFGSVKPTGWIKAQMQQDLDGFVGHLDELVPDLMDDKIYGADRLTRNQKSKNLGNIGPQLDPQYLWWNSETQSNWRDGFIRNAILLDDKEYLTKAEAYINYILSTQDPDGYLGIYSPDLRYNFKGENGELWSKVTLFRGLLAWYEYSQNQAVLKAVIKAVDDVMKHYPVNASTPFASENLFSGGLSHGLVFTDVLEKLYALTQNEAYLRYAVFLYKDFSTALLSEDAQFQKIMDPGYRLKEHGVHTYEHLRPLVLAWSTTGNEELKKALNIYLKRISDCTLPSGGPVGDEWVASRMADATHTGYEYCSIHELMDGYLSLLQKTGETTYADLTERIFFNAAQGARHPEHSSIAYCKTDNSFAMTGSKNGEEQGAEKQTRFKYSPAHQDAAVCCVPNAGRITPYYVQSMWLKDAEGLVAALPGPCQLLTLVNGTKVSIAENTTYPYSNTITYEVSASKPVTFTLKIRIPEWAKQFQLNTEFVVKNGYIEISRNWKKREVIQLTFEAIPQVKTDRNNEKYYMLGALVFALPVNSSETITRTYSNPAFADRQYEATGLHLYKYPVSESTIEIEHNDTAADIRESISLKTTLINEKTQQPEQVRLVPLSTTILRQLTFKNEVQTSSGSVKRFKNFGSEFIDSRTVDVWLPAGYNTKTEYNVLYMHDGQMLFDSSTTWNKADWGVDETLSELIEKGEIKPCIVVGIWNTARRHAEYFPQKPFETLSVEQRGGVNRELQNMGMPGVFEPVSDNYLKFITNELKPFIDSAFSTSSNRESTFIAGSSMGGLISMYALCEYPEVFGGAACMSTHWPGTFAVENNPVPPAFFDYLAAHLPDPETHKIYFDYGDQTLDAMYPPLQKKADLVLESKGYTAKNWLTRFFPGTNHSEQAWNKRFGIPVLFLMHP